MLIVDVFRDFLNVKVRSLMEWCSKFKMHSSS